MSDKRYFLQLMDETEDVKLVKEFLKSPLGLSEDLIYFLFNNNYDVLKNNLDKIKLFVGGIKRARSISGYGLASYYDYMFSFNQFFNSSFRARQGKVLEVILQYILKNYCNCDLVAGGNKAKIIVKGLFKYDESPTLDIDALGKNSKDSKAIVIQLRSRDDTGGTTAKGSLADLLRDFLRNNKDSDVPLLYLVTIWDERDLNQKKATIKKIYSQLKDYLLVSEKGFYSDIVKDGVRLKNNLTLQLSYGTVEMAETLFKWSGSTNEDIKNSIEKIVQDIENWDDLWISYAISSIEIDTKFTKGFSNVDLLNNYIKKLGLVLNRETSYDKLHSLIDDYATQIYKCWRENSIPFQNPREQYLYIRDLLFLKYCYGK